MIILTRFISLTLRKVQLKTKNPLKLDFKGFFNSDKLAII